MNTTTEQLRAELERVTKERNALDIELTGSKYAVALLRRECGLDEQSEDLREVALLVKSLNAQLDAASRREMVLSATLRDIATTRVPSAHSYPKAVQEIVAAIQDKAAAAIQPDAGKEQP